MKTKFIEVTDVRSDKKVSINIEKITQFEQGDKGDIGAEIYTTLKYIPVYETYREIQEMLGIEQSTIDFLINESKTDNLTKRQKELLAKLWLIYIELAEECEKDERFNDYISNYNNLFPLSLNELALDVRAILVPDWNEEGFNPKYVKIAVGQEAENCWFVQTTDIHSHTSLSMSIAEQLKTKEEAMEIAKRYSEQYGLKIVEWD